MEQVMFGKYKWIRSLGGGGMGNVALVKHVPLGVERALKTMKEPGCAESRIRFEREARTMGLLRHPRIPVVHDFAMGDEPYIEMDFIDGVPISEFRLEADRSVRCRQILHVAKQVCEVLSYCHVVGVVHRDLKPANLIAALNPTNPLFPDIYVIDFGLNKLVDQTRITYQAVGTFRYASPEQIYCPTAVNHLSDLYSLAVIVIELVTGHCLCPWIFGLSSPPTNLGGDHPIYDHVERWLAPPPKDRPQSAEELLQEIHQCLHGS